jgi:hypothetical protein
VPATVLVKDIVEALQVQNEQSLAFLDPDSGKVEHVSKDLMSAAEDGENEDMVDDLPDWQKPEWETVLRIVSDDRFLRLPTSFEIHERSIMQDFANSVQSRRIGDELDDALHGSGAFRHFRATLRRNGIESHWSRFFDKELRRIAIDWCEKYDIPWQ